MAKLSPFLSLQTRKTWYSEYSKIIATSGFLTALERTKFVFGRGSAPVHAGGAYSAPPAGFKRSTYQGEGREKGK